MIQQTQQQPAGPRKTSTDRVHRFRERQRAKAKAAERAARDAKRIAKGLLPFDEANRAKVKKHYERKRALKAELSLMWFAPELSRETVTERTGARNKDWGRDFVQTLVDGYVRACRAAGVNLNAFSMVHGAHRANHARTVFHELRAAGVPLLEAAQRSHVEPFKENEKLSGVAQAVDITSRFEAAQLEWGRGDELWEAIAG